MPSLLFEQFTSRRRTGQPMRRPSFEKVLRPGIVEDLKIPSRCRAQQCFPRREGLQHDADLALRRKMPPRRGGCPSQTFPPAPSPAPGDGIGPEVMAEVEKIATRFTREGIVHFKVEKDLWAAPPMAFTNSDQRCRHGARASGGRGAACRRRWAEMGCRPL
jgi:hypothetical protein